MCSPPLALCVAFVLASLSLSVLWIVLISVLWFDFFFFLTWFGSLPVWIWKEPAAVLFVSKWVLVLRFSATCVTVLCLRAESGWYVYKRGGLTAVFRTSCSSCSRAKSQIFPKKRHFNDLHIWCVCVCVCLQAEQNPHNVLIKLHLLLKYSFRKR